MLLGLLLGPEILTTVRSQPAAPEAFEKFYASFTRLRPAVDTSESGNPYNSANVAMGAMWDATVHRRRVVQTKVV